MNGFLGKITLYSLTYDKIAKLNYHISVPSDNTVTLCLVDNLLIVNIHNEFMSMIFDLKRYNPAVPIGPAQPTVLLKRDEQHDLLEMSGVTVNRGRKEVVPANNFSQQDSSRLYSSEMRYMQDDIILDI
jgi:hypothetical protein